MNKIDKNADIEEKFILAEKLYQEKNLEFAENTFKEILDVNPFHFKSIMLLASVSVQLKKFDKAKLLFEKAIEIDPKFIPALNNLGNVEKLLGNLTNSINCFKKIIQINPNYINAFYNLGIVFFEYGDYKKSKQFYEKTIQINPKHINSFYNLAQVFSEMGEYEQTVNCYKKAIEIKPDFVAAHNNLGLALTEIGKFEEAILSYNKAIKIEPGHASSYNNLGLAFTELGKFSLAKKYYKKALKLEPDNLSHLYYLNILENKIVSSKVKNKIDNLIKERNISSKQKAYANFLLSKYEYSKKNYSNEFNHLVEGHSHYLNSQSENFKRNINYWLKELPKIIKLNIDDAKTDDFNTKIKPIFIIGVPRCGSTLIEKIIASGSKLIPMGEETGILQNFFNKERILYKDHLSNNDIKEFRKKLIEKYKTRNLVTKKSNFVFTDKSLENFYYVELIKKIFPNCKIINCSRRPLFSIMSIFKNNLTKMTWAHNVESIFDYFDIYFNIINNSKKRFPNYIYNLKLEEFINNPKSESKKLMNFCDLPWSSNCLKFYKRKDVISRTASNIQVRKAIFKNNSRKYEPYKGCLKKYSNKYNWFN